MTTIGYGYLQNRVSNTQDFDLFSEDDVPPKDISRLTTEFRGGAKRSPLERPVRLYVSETLESFQK